MKRFDIRNLTTATFQAVITAFSLACLLAYTWLHTATLLARYVDPDVFGYICATGIEFAIVSLSLRIGQERRNERHAYGFVAVLVAVLIVSALANVAEGFATAYAELLTLRTVRAVDPLQALFGCAATGLIPLVVFALSDIIGGDVRRAAQASARSERKAEQAAQPVTERPEPAAQVLRLPVAPERTYACQCGAAFARQQQLAAHMRRCAAAIAKRAAQ